MSVVEAGLVAVELVLAVVAVVAALKNCYIRCWLKQGIVLCVTYSSRDALRVVFILEIANRFRDAAGCSGPADSSTLSTGCIS
jgi:hypothetical protein